MLANIGNLAKIVFVDVGQDGQSNQAVTDLHIDEPFVITGKPVHDQGDRAEFRHRRQEQAEGRAERRPGP